MKCNMDAMNSLIINSQVDDTAQIYYNVKIHDSYIGQKCAIGDGSIVRDSVLHGRNNLNRGCHISFSEIGEGTALSRRATLSGVHIGKYGAISWNTNIGGKTHDYETGTIMAASWWAKVFELEHVPDNTFNYPSYIGNDVWICSNATILRSANIADGVIVAAGAVVTKDVEPYAIVGGNPARVIKKRYGDKTIEQLLQIKWWDWPWEIIRENTTLIRNKVTQESLEKMMEITCGLE